MTQLGHRGHPTRSSFTPLALLPCAYPHTCALVRRDKLDCRWTRPLGNDERYSGIQCKSLLHGSPRLIELAE